MIRLTAALLLMLGLARAALAQPADLHGNWLGFAVTGILGGLTVPVVEELVVTGDSGAQRGWTLPADPAACTGGPGAPVACALSVDLGAVRLVAEGGTLRADPAGPQTVPHADPIDAGLWPGLALAGHVWAPAGGADRLILSRAAQVQGEALTLERVYLRAPRGTAGALFHYLVATQQSVARAICGVLALHDQPQDWARFTDLLATMAPVTAELNRLSLIQRAGRADRLRAMTLLHGPQVVGDLAADVSDVPESARTAWLDHRAWLADGARPWPGRQTLSTLGFQASPEAARAEAACLDYYLSP